MRRPNKFWEQVEEICLVDSGGPGLGSVRQSLLAKLRAAYLLDGPKSISKTDMKPCGERHEFASDNTAAICPEAMKALENANVDGAPSYGEDRWTARVCDRIRQLFEIDCDVYLVFNGT